MAPKDTLNLKLSKLELKFFNGSFYCFSILGLIRIQHGFLMQEVIGQLYIDSSTGKACFTWFFNGILDEEQKFIVDEAIKRINLIEGTFRSGNEG